jgi:hypothetical protein
VPSPAPSLEWYLLVHQLPPRPLYLRAKIRNRLARVGALALKNSVYVLPARAACLEDFQWIAQEATAGGGEAFVCSARFVAGISEESLVARFRAAAAEAYDVLHAELARLRAPLGPEERTRLERRQQEIRAIDFFETPRRRAVEEAMRKLQETPARAARGVAGRAETRPSGRTWVTRKDPHVDRLASAWLIRRFVDPRARFRFIDPQRETLRRAEIGFDMVGAAYTHEGDRCTFETLVRRFGVADAGVAAIAEIVHDLDLKDDRYGRPATAGVAQLVSGLTAAYADDSERVRRAIALFDDLHASFKAGPRRRTVRRTRS